MRQAFLAIMVAGLVSVAPPLLHAQTWSPPGPDSARLARLLREWGRARTGPDSLARLAALRPLADSLDPVLNPLSPYFRLVQTQLRYAAARALLDSALTSHSCAEARRADSLVMAGHQSAIYNDHSGCDTVCQRHFAAVYELSARTRHSRAMLCGPN